MSSPAVQKPVEICLADIRLKLSEITDKQLSLDVLDYLDSQEKLLAEKIAINLEILTRNDTLVTSNNNLFARVSTFNDRETPTTVTDYTAIDRTLNDIIDKL